MKRKWLLLCLYPRCKRYCVEEGTWRTEWKRADLFKLKVLSIMYKYHLWEMCDNHRVFKAIFEDNPNEAA